MRDMGTEEEIAMPKELIDLTLQLHHETVKAFLVSDDGDENHAVWIPKSQCEQGTAKGNGAYEFTMPEWLAMDKELI
jgi:hypothetical protein